MDLNELVIHLQRASGIPIILDDGSYIGQGYDCHLGADYHAAYICEDLGNPFNRETEKVLINMNSLLTRINPFRVLFHELCHATGKSSIFSRPAISCPFRTNVNGVREMEEIIVDTAAMTLLRELGLSSSVVEDNHSDYVDIFTLRLYSYGLTLTQSRIDMEVKLIVDYVKEHWLMGYTTAIKEAL